MKKLNTLIICLFFALQAGYAATYYVSVNGNDSSDGSAGNPWRTLRAAASKVPANQGHTIKLLGGTFVETGFINVPTGVNIEGSGIGVTILKPSPSMYFKSYAWAFDKFLLILNGGGAGNQSVKNLTIDGDNKQLYGGIVVNGRNNVLIEGVRVQYTYYTGIWMWETLDCRLTRLQLKDCAWGGSGGASGSVKISRSERLEIDHCDFDEAHGQALDAVGSGKMYDLKVHDNIFSVSPVGNWQTPEGNTVPNLAVEFYEVTLRGCQVYNNYFDNTFSIVMAEAQFEKPTGVQTIRVYNNTFDLVKRANGSGSGMELTVHDAEVDHNYFYGGATAIANWDASPNPFPMQNWKIHHNVFYGIDSYYPTAIINMYKNGINNAHIYNNTVETTGTSTVNFIEVNNAGVARNVRVENNLIIDSNSSYRWYPNKLISLANGATMQDATVRNNFVQKMAIGTVAGAAYSGNLSGDPKINRSGNRPKPYYELTSGSPLIDKGVQVGSAYSGNAPDIGAFESGGTAEPQPNELPSVAITAPADGGSTGLGTTVTISANASDSDGSISKVQFFQGSTLLGEDNTSPYTFAWQPAATGDFVLKAKAIDNEGGQKTSDPVMISVTSSSPPVVSITSPANNATFEAGSAVTITAQAGDADGISKVEFFNGSTKLGEDLTSPYTFAWTAVAGTHQLTAKATDNKGSTVVSSVVTINVSAENIAPTISITKPADNHIFDTGSTILIEVFATDKDGQITKVAFFNGQTKLGEDTSSPHSFSWNDAPEGTHNLTAKAFDDKNSAGVSEPITVIVRDQKPPIVSITSPKNNTSFAPGSDITISADAADQDGTISKVEFYAGTTKLGQATGAPYDFKWIDVAAGTYLLTVKAFDNTGATSISDAVTINLAVDENILPTVEFTKPADNASVDAGTAITFEAIATDKDGQITKVEFYNGTTKLGEDISSPYNFVWTNAQEGTHKVTAKAFDDKGATVTSVPLTLVVNGSNLHPTVVFTKPANNTSVDAGTDITFEVFATDKDGQITKVEFYNGTTKLGEDTSSPHNFVWTNAPEGTHQIAAKTFDNAGAAATSDPLTITVNGANLHPTVAFTKPADNTQVDAGTDITFEVSATDEDGQIAKVAFFNGSTKLGEDTSSPYNFVWTNAPEGTHKVTARAFDDKGATGTSVPLTVSVNGSNLHPTVVFTKPANNTSVDAGTDISFEVFATDKDGQIMKVEFYNGATKLGEDTSSPHNFIWTNAPEGTHQITARTFDNKGATGTSDPLTITVNGANLHPTVAFTKPSNNTAFDAGTDITFEVSATDEDGQIAKVAFFNGSTKLGEDTSSPYNFVWTNAPEGTHKVTAKAFDDKGAAATSIPLTVAVNGSNLHPTVEFTRPSNDARVGVGTDIIFEVFATDKDGQITKVEFYNGTNRLGEDTSSPHNFVWTNAPEGTHQITARTFDNLGATGVSQPLTVTVIGTNLHPTVEFTKPANNTSVDAGTDITFEVFATDKDGQITKVEFYNGTTKLGEDTSSPHNFVWSNAPEGTHQITAKTFDNKGATGTSSPLTITVAGSNLHPTVEFTTPENNTSFKESDAIFFQVFATDKDGQITRVEFYNGGEKLAEDTSSPHNFVWTGAPVGTHQLTAKTFDNKGASGTSRPLTINIIGSNLAPTVEFTTPEDSASFDEGSDVFLQVFATDRDGQITRVEFYDDDVLLSEDTSSPHNFLWKDAPAGTHRLTAKTFDNNGAYGTSRPLTIIVNRTNMLPMVESSGSSVAIPRFFTPNNDGVNDDWMWSHGNPEGCHLKVYDQAGTTVFESQSYNNDWDGTAGSKQLSEGAYLYVASCGEDKITGAVRIIR